MLLSYSPGAELPDQPSEGRRKTELLPGLDPAQRESIIKIIGKLSDPTELVKLHLSTSTCLFHNFVLRIKAATTAEGL